MRLRCAGARVRLLLALLLLVASCAIGPVPPGDSPATSPRAAVAKSDHDLAKRDRGTTKHRDGKSRTQQGQRKSAGSSPTKSPTHHGSGRQLAAQDESPLDVGAIAVANADDVTALDCGDLIAIHVGDRTYCTHGEDSQPIDQNPPPTGAANGGLQSQALCLDDGMSGPRVQLVYVYRNDRSNRLSELLPTFRRLAAEVDGIFDQSAHKTGGSLRLRYVTDASCRVDVASLVAAPRSIEGFGSLMQKMSDAGFNRLDRKYLMLVDDSIYCGVGTFNGGAHADDSDTQAHNFTGYARVDSPCWDAGTMAHELSHTLGAVQYSAPHNSGGAHCIDEWDVMCYSDAPLYPRMQFPCEESSQDFRLDCHDDDYFAAQPAAGSYLSRHWNMANSPYLSSGGAPTCADAALEPDDAYWYSYWETPLPKYPVGESQSRAFCEEPGDTDWALFEAHGGSTYRIETANLASGVNTQLALYRGYEGQGWEGMDQIAANDDRAPGDLSSLITFTAPADGAFLVGVAEAGGQAGFDKTYTLTIHEAAAGAGSPITLSRSTARPGTPFTATVSGLTPGAEATFWWTLGEEESQLGTAIAGGDGAALGSYKVPRNARRVEYQIEMIASDGAGATATLKVIGGNDDKHGKSGKNGKAKKHKHKKHGKGGRRH